MDDDATALLNTVLAYQAILESLCSAPKTKPELLEECDVSRSTIDRWLRELEAANLVRRPGDRFELTLFGQLVKREQARTQARIDQFLDLREPLIMLSDEKDIDPRVFDDAEIKSYAGNALQLGNELLTQPGRLKLVASDVASVPSMFLFSSPHQELELEAILDAELISQLVEYSLHRKEHLLSVVGGDVYKLDDSPPYCLALLEEKEQSTVYLIFGGITNSVGVIKNTNNEAVAWGERLYRNYREQATVWEWPDLNQALDVLRESHRRLILTSLLNGTVKQETDVMVRGASSKADDSRLTQKHLPLLEEAGYIEWNQESGTIAKGPTFDKIVPLLELIEKRGNKLPPEWV